jgi:uncharacterized membrane protein
VTKLDQKLAELRSSLWFVPGLLVIAAVGLATGLVGLDHALKDGQMAGLDALIGSEPAVSRDMLSMVANSMLTAAALAFSMTIVALTLASTQFSPRILRNFMRDMTTQVVIGIFVGSFVYCLLVLRTIRESEPEVFVPTLAVAVGAASGLLGIGALIYYLHHIAWSIQASNIITVIARETTEVVDRIYSERPAPPIDEATVAALRERDWTPLPAGVTGYLQYIDTDGLVALATRHGIVIRVERRVGEFVVAGTPLAMVAATHPAAAADVTRQVNELCVVASTRTIEQDVAFGLRQLVDVSLKALSPAVNDTTTALNCIDNMTAIMVRLAGRHAPSPYHRDGNEIRVIAEGQSFEDLFDLAFHQIRQNAGGNVAVLLRLCAALASIVEASAPGSNQWHRLAAEELRVIARTAERTIEAPEDRQKALRHIARYARRCGEPEALRPLEP